VPKFLTSLTSPIQMSSIPCMENYNILESRTLKAMPASAQERSPKRPSAGRQNAERPSLRFTSVYSALAIVASGVLPLRCTRPRCSAIRVISPAGRRPKPCMLSSLSWKGHA